MGTKLILAKPICEMDYFTQYILDGGIMVGRDCLITKTREGILLFKVDPDETKCQLPGRLCEI